MILNNKYDYQPLSRETGEGGRRYMVNGVPVPSVTTILSKMKDMSVIDEWRERIGEENADRVVKESTIVGSEMHDQLEKYILGQTRVKKGNPLKATGFKLAEIIIEKGLSHMSECFGTEIALHFDQVYAGTTDLTGVYKGKEAIVDFKNSRHPKKPEYLETYKMQLVSYGLAHNNMFGTNIRTGCNMIVSREGKSFGIYQESLIEGDEWDHYSELWVKTLEDYYKLMDLPETAPFGG